MKRLISVTTLAVAGLVVALGAVSSGGAQERGVQTISLVQPDEGGSFHFVDNPPRQGLEAPPLAGDTFVGSQPLFTRAGKRAGTLDFECTVITGGERGRTHCTGVYSLAGGTIAGQVVFPGPRPVTRIAITGGTGAYEGARGSIISRDRRNDTVDTIRLLP
jgi:hypothetical protein